jgi:hypothetical protein
MCMNVDLPEPDGPTMVTNSPASTSSETPRNASTESSPTVYVFVRFCSEMSGSVSFDGYQFTFMPILATRGGTIAVGRRYELPDAQMMFWFALLFRAL